MLQSIRLRYLKGTVDYGLKYKDNHKTNLEGYVDSDWEGSAIDRKSTSRCCFSMGSSVISWFRRNQSYATLSKAEVEYVIDCSSSCEVVWLRKLLSNLFSTCIYCKNHSCVKMLENPMFHDKSKHIKIKYHYIRYMVQRGAVKLQVVATEE